MHLLDAVCHQDCIMKRTPNLARLQFPCCSSLKNDILLVMAAFKYSNKVQVNAKPLCQACLNPEALS